MRIFRNHFFMCNTVRDGGDMALSVYGLTLCLILKKYSRRVTQHGFETESCPRH